MTPSIRVSATAAHVPNRIVRALRTASRTLQIAHEAAPQAFVRMVVGTTLAALIGPAAIMATGKLLDAIAQSRGTGGFAVLMSPAAAPLLGALLATAFLQRALDRVLERTWEIFARGVSLEIGARTIETVAHADASVIEDPTFYDRIVRARGDAAWRPQALTQTLTHIFSSTVTLCALFAGLASLHPVLLLLAVVSVVPTLVVRAGIGHRIFETSLRAAPQERERDYLYNLAGNPRFHAEQKAFNLAGPLIARVRALGTSRLEQDRVLYREANVRDVVGAVIAALALLGAYAFLFERGARGVLTVGEVAASLAAFASVTGHLSAMLGAFLIVDQHAPFLRELFALFDDRPRLANAAAPVPLPARIEALRLDGATFGYPASRAPVLNDIALSLRRGEKVALVGENGAGKSTLVKLLLRFFDPLAGRVVVEGDGQTIDVRDVDPLALRGRIGVLFQDYARFELPVSEGIRFGRAEQPLDEARARAAIAAASATAVVADLGGLHGIAGRVLEGGHDLSGGQWQRLALARLLYRDADVWILDEPTASLDPAAEAAVFEDLFALAADRAVLVISHRFATARACDRIYVIEGTRILEEGSHDALMKKGGRYAALFDLQAEGYR